MFNNDNYLNKYFKYFNDGSVILMAKTRSAAYTVDASILQEDGEDPIIEASVSVDYLNPHDYEFGKVYLKMSGHEITETDCFEAIDEFLLG